MAPAYSDANLYPKFGSFVRAVIGLPYTPLKRLDEAMKILEKMAQATTGSRRKFCQHLLKYLYKTWLNGCIPREVWNMYQHPGVTTNNHAEAFNSKMGAKKKISRHPNPYVLAEEMIVQLKEGLDTATAETLSGLIVI